MRKTFAALRSGRLGTFPPEVELCEDSEVHRAGQEEVIVLGCAKAQSLEKRYVSLMQDRISTKSPFQLLIVSANGSLCA